MIRKRTARMISLTTIVVVVAMLIGYFAITFAASAAPAPGETYIVQKTGGTPYFHSNKLSCTHPCSITIKNTLGSTQTITSTSLKQSITLAAHQSTSVSYTKAGTYTYNVGSHQLTVTVS